MACQCSPELFDILLKSNIELYPSTCALEVIVFRLPCTQALFKLLYLDQEGFEWPFARRSSGPDSLEVFELMFGRLEGVES